MRDWEPKIIILKNYKCNLKNCTCKCCFNYYSGVYTLLYKTVSRGTFFVGHNKKLAILIKMLKFLAKNSHTGVT